MPDLNDSAPADLKIASSDRKELVAPPSFLHEDREADISRYGNGRRMSQAVRFGRLIFLSGQVADDPTGGIEQQAREVLSKVDRLLAMANSGKSNILSATIWLTEAGSFDAFNRVWEQWVDPLNTPARATVVAALVAPGLLIEAQVVACTSSAQHIGSA
jgi:enamine deaminase RidA (YjgF/YER057c/UK114 family)